MLRVKIKAQSMLEYVIVLAAVVAIIIYAAGHWIKGDPVRKTGVSGVIANAATAIEKATDEIAPPPAK